MFYLVIISDATNDFLSGGNEDLLNWLKLTTKAIARQFTLDSA